MAKVHLMWDDWFRAEHPCHLGKVAGSNPRIAHQIPLAPRQGPGSSASQMNTGALN